ncbi:lipopolysaccharide biosynthesis protein [Mucilaginibacter sp.]|uniref:lipopolysaccharide biosynthesis protein n=1 Tax=Mucilaginibacter sp. TaxID=1882438 RepID=UPI0035BBB7F5
MFNKLALKNLSDARSKKQLFNIVISALAKGGAIACSFLFVPMCLNYLDVRSYGIWLTMTSIVSWISFLDGGLGNGLKNKLSEAVVNDDENQSRALITSAYVGIFLIVGIAIVLFLASFKFIDFSKVFNAPEHMSGELSTVFLVVFIFFCVKLLLDLINTILLAFQKVWLVNVIALLINACLLGGVYYITRHVMSERLYYLSFYFSVLPVAVLTICTLFFFSTKYKRLTPEFKFFKMSALKQILSIGAKFFVIQIAVIIIFSTDNLLISQLFEPSEVAIYNIAFKYFSVFTFAWSIVIAPYWVSFNEAFIKGDFEWIKKTINFLLKCWMILFAGVVVFLLLSNYSYNLWLGPKVKVPVLLSIMMALFVLISTFANIYVYFINGIGKIKLQFYTSIIAGLVNLPLSYFFAVVVHFGVSGIMMGTCLSLISGPVFGYLQYKAIINKTAKGIWLQ